MMGIILIVCDSMCFRLVKQSPVLTNGKLLAPIQTYITFGPLSKALNPSFCRDWPILLSQLYIALAKTVSKMKKWCVP